MIGQPIIQPNGELKSDLIGDRTICRVVWKPSSKHPVVVIVGKKRLNVPVAAAWRPWKVLSARLTGQTRDSLIVGVFKSTHNIPQRHASLFVFGLRDGEIVPLWRGSHMSVSFNDFRIIHHRSGDKVSLLASIPNQTPQWLDFTWNGFGFKRHTPNAFNTAHQTLKRTR